MASSGPGLSFKLVMLDLLLTHAGLMIWASPLEFSWVGPAPPPHPPHPQTLSIPDNFSMLTFAGVQALLTHEREPSQLHGPVGLLFFSWTMSVSVAKAGSPDTRNQCAAHKYM